MAEVRLEVTGLGIILYSPASASHIRDGQDYLQDRYTDPKQVQEHLQAGTIVGFGTQSPGTFVLKFLQGLPDDEVLAWSSMQLRLAVRVVDEALCVRDLYDLMEWSERCHPSQIVKVPNGIHHVTLCSREPASGILGDEQEILVYLRALDRMPELEKTGIPTLSPA